jgi:hypothetical protein
MKRMIVLIGAILATACARPGGVSVRPGTDMALPEPTPSPAADVLGAALCVVTRTERGDVASCPQQTDSLRAVHRPPVAVSTPQMRVRTRTSVFRRG